MKRSHSPFIGALACISALTAAHHETAIGALRSIPAVRSESAGGNVSLRALRDDEKEKARAKIREQEAGTYVPEILLARDSALARWKPRSRPLTVWVQSRPDFEDWTDDYVQAVSDAFMEWDAVELPVRFKMVTDSAQAEIHVTWTPRFDEQISGRTRWSRDDNWWITNASILLAIHHNQGDRLDQSAMKAMALHEVGHLLGLDHTSIPMSIMAPRVRVRELAQVDIATARVIYSVSAGPLKQGPGEHPEP
jgi:predicted Zn-dependent protease